MAGRCSGCDPIPLSGCQCSIEDTDCFEWEGAGTPDDPFRIRPVIDPDVNNWLSCGSQGLLVDPPSQIINPPRVRVLKTVDVAVETSLLTNVSFDASEDYDSAGMYDGPGDPTRVTCVMDGCHDLKLGAGWEEPAAAAFASFALYKQPANVSVLSCAIVLMPGPGSPNFRNYVATDVELEAGDWLEVKVFQNTGADLILQGVVLTARWVAPLT